MVSPRFDLFRYHLRCPIDASMVKESGDVLKPKRNIGSRITVSHSRRQFSFRLIIDVTEGEEDLLHRVYIVA